MSAIAPWVAKAANTPQPIHTAIMVRPTATVPSSLPYISCSGLMVASTVSSSLFDRSSIVP